LSIEGAIRSAPDTPLPIFRNSFLSGCGAVLCGDARINGIGAIICHNKRGVRGVGLTNNKFSIHMVEPRNNDAARFTDQIGMSRDNAYWIIQTMRPMQVLEIWRIEEG
ncbi:hypothetical protein KCU81_g620, partial [Aureobasidium melanogenum]